MRRAAVGGQEIPRFFLYGEAPRTAGFCIWNRSTIAAARTEDDPAACACRSEPHLLHDRRRRRIADRSRHFPLEAPALLIVPARAVRGFRWQPETEGHVPTVADA
jgi:hypothetical protein